MTQYQAGLVSVITPVFNRETWVLESFESVLAQTYPQFEIIFIDDGSTDNTPEVLRGLASKHPKIVRIITQENNGPGYARQQGLDIAKGEFIQYLDSDDLLLPRKFELQVKALTSTANAAIAYGKTREYSIKDGPGSEPSRSTGESFDTMFPLFLKSRGWNTVTPLYRTTLCRSIGPWLNTRQEEDWEYDCRLAVTNPTLVWCDEFIADHRHHGDHRLSTNWTRQKDAIEDILIARNRILDHAIAAGVDSKSMEMRHFSKYQFLMARQCGGRGLNNEANRFIDLATRASSDPHRISMLSLYKRLSERIGWHRTYRISLIYERFKSKTQTFKKN